jgi:hypothetical protein
MEPEVIPICKLSNKNIIRDEYNNIRKMQTDCGGRVKKISYRWKDITCLSCLNSRK